MLVPMVIGLQHLILKENNYNQKNLTISVSTNFISLSESDFSTDSLITFKKKSFDNPISVENITGELGTMLDKNNIKNENFNKIKLIQENDLFVFVPEELYSSKEKKNYLKFNTKIQENDYLAVDDIDRLRIKNVYIPYINVNNFLVDIFKNMSELIYEMIEEIIEKKITPQPQIGDATIFKRRTPDMSLLPSKVTLKELYDYIRMLDAPTYPHAFIEYGDFVMRFTEAEECDTKIFAKVEITKKENQHTNIIV